MTNKYRFALLLVASLFAVSANGAPVAYSVNSDSGSENQDSLYQIDLATGIEERQGLLSAGSETRDDTEGLAMDADGNLWGVDDDSRTIFKINKNAGFISAEEPLYDFPYIPTLGGNDFGMTFSCDNTLYAATVQTQTLYKLNPADGIGEIIGTEGSLGVNISAIAANDDPDFLYAIGSGTYDNGEIDSPNLYRIDLLTGIPTIIGPLGMGTTISDYDQAGLAFDSQGVLWAITDRRIINDQKAANQPSEILRININTGAAEVVWTTQEIGFESLAIAPPIACDSLNPVEEPGDDVPHIPTLSTLGQMLAVFVLMFAGMLVLRRRIS
ncbi:MAG: hypothetical protein OEU84_06000 [Xanthomonadales bacterium]|nr:hypothetical protein [Xanthomonadales bacterium]MDH4019136.1 hypothetical protein [Xanthomonadales bacterium]